MTETLRLLWIKSGPLFPLNTGGRRRTHAMLVELAKTHRVTWLAGLPAGTTLADGEASDPYAREKIWVETRETRKGSPPFYAEVAANCLFSRLPYVLTRYRDESFARKIGELGNSGDFDLVICDFLTPALDTLRNAISTPVVLFQHNIESEIWRRLADEKKSPLARWYFRNQCRRMHTTEADLCWKFDGVITVSPEDAAFSRETYRLENVLGAVPTGVDTGFFSPPTRGRSPQKGLIGFLGSMDWMPNIECVQHFARDIFPAIREAHPDARFRIIGRDPAPTVRRLAEEDAKVEVTGTVDDVRPHLDDCELIVVPLRSGGGTRIKIFEAMSQGCPVVSTTVGAEGLPVTHDQDILIADSSGDFSSAVIRILDSDELGARLSHRARTKLVQDHSWQTVAEQFIALCRPVLS